MVLVCGEKRDSRDVVARCGQIESHLCTEKLVRNLGQDAGAVTGVLLSANRTAVVKVHERRQACFDNVVPRRTSEGGNEGDTTRIVLGDRIVQSLSGLGGSPDVRGPGLDELRGCRTHVNILLVMRGQRPRYATKCLVYLRD